VLHLHTNADTISVKTAHEIRRKTAQATARNRSPIAATAASDERKSVCLLACGFDGLVKGIRSLTDARAAVARARAVVCIGASRYHCKVNESVHRARTPNTGIRYAVDS
jgi:hypothetical protein